MGMRHIGFDHPSLKGSDTWNRLRRSLTPHPGTLILTVVVVLGLLWAQSAGALPLGRTESSISGASTGTVPYQGRLADTAGNPLTATYNMIFRLYNASSGGVPLWEEQWTGPNSVQVSDGLFNVMLGSLTPIPQEIITQNSSLWLGITVDTDDEMAPRLQLGSVPFAVQALTVPDNSVTTTKIADGTIEAADLASGIVVPVGTVISWWRPDVNTPLPSGEWAIADGTVVTDPASPYNGKALPDLRNRFVMGVTADDVGQTGGTNTLDLSHRHLADSHTHALPSHNHWAGGLTACLTAGPGVVFWRGVTGDQWETNAHWTAYNYGSDLSGTFNGTDIVGYTDVWSGISGTAQPYTDYQLSSSVDNRPQYVGLVYLVKIK